MYLNAKSLFFLTKALAKPLRAAASHERPAKVINIASIDGIFVNPTETYSYAASKAAVIHLTRRMATKLIKEHINVTAIAPGAFASDMNKAARDHGDVLAKRIPAQRIGTDEDMAGIAIYLASRAGDYVVGNTTAVDGGVVYACAIAKRSIANCRTRRVPITNTSDAPFFTSPRKKRGSAPSASHLPCDLKSRVGIDHAAINRDRVADDVVAGTRGKIDRDARHVIVGSVSLR